MTHEAKYKVGDIVLACHSGKSYKITEAWALDEHGSFGYAARGWRGGKLYGATRRFAESGLQPSTVYYGADEHAPRPGEEWSDWHKRTHTNEALQRKDKQGAA